MTAFVPIGKDEDRQQPVPSAWRTTLVAIVEALRTGNSTLRGIAGVAPLDAETARWIAGQIDDYGARLVPLPEAAWDSAASQWQLTHWQVLVDLFTPAERPSDLAMHLRVCERDEGFAFTLLSVHVP